MTMKKGRLGKWTALIASSCGLADEVFGRLFVEMAFWILWDVARFSRSIQLSTPCTSTDPSRVLHMRRERGIEAPPWSLPPQPPRLGRLAALVRRRRLAGTGPCTTLGRAAGESGF
jgi:hypothetical protein